MSEYAPQPFGDNRNASSSCKSHRRSDGKPPAKRRPANNSDGRQPKKRTKTGCLTCRRRRIKCGEEKPCCANCFKSKRPCELSIPPALHPSNASSHEALAMGPASNDIAPMNHLDPPLDFHPNWTSPFTNPGYSTPANPDLGSLASGHSTYFAHTHPQIHLHSADAGPPLPLRAHYSSSGWPPSQARDFEPSYGRTTSLAEADSPTHAWQGFRATLSDLASSGQAEDVSGLPIQSAPSSLAHTNRSSSAELHSYNTVSSTRAEHGSNADAYHYHSFNTTTSRGSEYAPSLSDDGRRHLSMQQPWRQPLVLQRMDSATQDLPPTKKENQIPDWTHPQVSECLDRDAVTTASLELGSTRLSYGFNSPPFFGNNGLTQFLDEAAVAVQDDDYYDIEPEDLTSDSDEQSIFEDQSLEHDLDAIVSLTKHSISLAVNSTRGSRPGNYPGFTMAEYRPERVASPLRNEYTQRVFAHYVFSTGPMISFLQQRHRPAMRGEGHQQPTSNTCLWSYLMAMMALHDQGLLHAMLAMSSYHMAKLDNGSVTPSLKHYTYAMKHIHRSVDNKGNKRHRVTTLAATLLLAFYEVIKADHRAWSTHLVGALQLLKEIDYAGMAAHIKFLKSHPHVDLPKAYGLPRELSPNSILDELFPDVDMHLVNKMKGVETVYDEYGQTYEEADANCRTTALSDAESREYQVFQDLFWYAARHDVIHALVGGNALLLDFKYYGVCLPRGPVGNASAAYGAWDHLILLIARLVKFLSSDRERKIKSAAANQAPRSTTSSMSSSSEAHTGRRRPGEPARGPPGPTFYGMAPSANGPSLMPAAFKPEADSPEAQPSSPYEMDLETATAMAMAEWTDIMDAFQLLNDAMGPSFQPINDPTAPPVHTPFGPAMFFSSYNIATLWAWYYGALIVAWRAHPSMPAPTILAVGAAMQKTAPFADLIGRILYPCSANFLQEPLDPTRAGAFAETIMPLFLAGVSYMDNVKRRWLLGRLREAESVTGWATIDLIAGGCESSWVGMYAAGLGPKWEKKAGIVMGDECGQIVEEEMPKLGLTILPPREASADGSDASEENAQREQVMKERRFAPFRKDGGAVMWAYQLYTPGVLVSNGI